jgi:predicted transcriptional regulator
MHVHLTPEQEARVAELAAREGRSADELVQEAIARYFEDDARFVAAVMKGLASLDRGEYLTHEEVGTRIDRLFER